MKVYVIKYIEYLAADRWIGDGVALLLSKGVEQDKIRKWCKKNPHLELAEHYSKDIPDSVAHCEGWEASFNWVADAFVNFYELNPWETASAEDRTVHSMKVAKLARELANALKESPSPYYPPVLALFDEDRALDIINSMPEEKARHLLRHTKYGDPSFVLIAQQKEMLLDSAAYVLSSQYYYSVRQEFPSLLRRLADYAEEKKHSKKRIARPNTGNANARAFGLHIADRIKQVFDRTPNEVIAACVCLKYPELEQPPNADTIRDWRGAK